MQANRLSKYFTAINLLVFGLIFGWQWLAPKIVHAQVPQKFLHPVYYGYALVSSVFDHEYPLLTDGNGTVEIPGDDQCGELFGDIVRHYDNSTNHGYFYDSHDGIDYDINYKPILASADGTVIEAGWSNPANHQLGLGLVVKINHNNSYKTYYGHLSVINVSVGDYVPREMIGVSGNTGNSSGSHLHFELRNPQNKPVNPYGWVGGAGNDPWATWQNPGGDCQVNYSNGATSYDLWENYPALTTAHYPSGTPVFPDPPTSGSAIIDDSSAAFVSGSNWSSTLAGDAYNGSYHYTIVGGNPSSPSRWELWNAQLPPASGLYELYVSIPEGVPPDPPINPADKAIYTIKHQYGETQAIVAQSEYPNLADPSGWAYLGNYVFSAFQQAANEIIIIEPTDDPPSQGKPIIADAIRLINNSAPTGCPFSFGGGNGSWDWTLTPSINSITLSWNDFGDFDHFDIYRNSSPSTYGWEVVHAGELDSSGSWVDANVQSGVMYYYWLHITECDGEGWFDGPKSAQTTSPPIVPTPCKNHWCPPPQN